MPRHNQRMRFFASTRGGILCAAIALAWMHAAGCTRLGVQELPKVLGSSPLKAATPTPDSAAIEIFLARIPQDEKLQKAIWDSVDEQVIAVETRKELMRNGFRAGVIGGNIPPELATALDMQDTKREKSSGDLTQRTGEELTQDSKVTRQWRRMRKGQRMEVQMSEVYPELQLLLNNDQGLNGRPYPQAQAMVALSVHPKPMQQVQFELIPELHYGNATQKYRGRGDAQQWRMEVSREKEIFDRLKMQVNLEPGELLIVGPDVNDGGSLGHYFHRIETPSGNSDRLLLIRLAEAPDERDLSASQ